MARRFVMLAAVFAMLLSGSAVLLVAQKAPGDNSVIRVDVELVQMNVAVTDKKGKYVTNLRPQDFEVVEDGAPQQVATFEEGNEAAKT